jgi:peptidyl-prolyl cis-trans isomerase SurA
MKKIVEDVEITPEEVRNFLKVLQRRITFLDEMKRSTNRNYTQDFRGRKKKVKRYLMSLKRYRGLSFATKAVLYSQDPGSANKWWFYKMNRKRLC